MPSQEPIHLFVYGTLTDLERVTSLTGKQFAGINATLNGFERVESPLGYPFIFPRSGAVVYGLLLQDVDPVSLVHLDAYEAEGDLYRRQVVEVEVSGMCLPAMVYVGRRIRAVMPQPSVQDSRPSHWELSSEPKTPTRRHGGPLAGEQ